MKWPRICHIRVRQSKINNCAQRRLIGALNMNSLRSRERAQTNGAVEVFSKLEGEIREVYFRSATAPRVPQQNDKELTARVLARCCSECPGRRCRRSRSSSPSCRY